MEALFGQHGIADVAIQKGEILRDAAKLTGGHDET